MTDRPKRWPLVEVIAEFHFPAETWREDVPDRLYRVLMDRFPVRKKREMTTHQLSIRSSSLQTFDLHQFFSSDGVRLVQVHKGLLTVNHLQPYSDWDVFCPLVQTALTAFLEVAPDAKPRGLGLTYINRIEIKGEHIDIDDYFEFRPRMEEDFLHCGCMAAHLWDEGSGVVTRQMQTQAPGSGRLPVSLVLQARTEQISGDHYLDWFEQAHERLNQEFKSSITATTYAMFEETGER
jgi:uncharacterized protein (TIGR04255 family)